MPTVPARSALVSRIARLTLPVHTVAASPYSVSLAIRTASSSSPNGITDSTGPKISSRAMLMSLDTSVNPFSDEDEAVRIANDTQYGLAATVWTSDIKRAFRMTKAIRAGTVGINGYTLEPHAAFGGYQQSGLGREGGRTAIESYTEVKTVLLPFTDEMM